MHILCCFLYRGFFGVTCLWLDAETLERKSAALCCHRVKGTMTYEKIAVELESVFVDYRIQNKVARVITDNGSNFLKAFRFVGFSTLKNETYAEQAL